MKNINKDNFLIKKSRFLFLLMFLLMAFHSRIYAQGVDAIFLLDNSRSIGYLQGDVPLEPWEYPDMKKSTQDLIDEILACNTYNRVAVMQYSHNLGATAQQSRLYIESDFTNNAVAAKNFDRRFSAGTFTWGAVALVDNALCASCPSPIDPESDEDNIVSSVKKLTRNPNNNLVVFLFTDGRPEDAAPYDGEFYDFSDYNNFKINNKATFVVLQVPSENGTIATSTAGAIASVGGSYTGWIEPNPGDPQGSGVTPRKAVMSSTFDASSIDINTLADNMCESCTPIVAINAVTPNTQSVCFNGTAQPLVADATGAGTLSYQWYRNTTNSTTGGTLIPGATSATFNPPTSVAATTYYYVKVSDTSCEGEATSPIVSITVSSTPCPCSAGTVAPALSNATVTSQTVDLSTMVTGTPPAGSVLQWHSSATPSAATLLPSNTVTATSTPTNYWAFYYSSTEPCYSPGAKVTVVSNACPSETVDLMALPHSTVPSGAELVWYKDGPYDDGGTLVADPETVGNGTYWPYFYDEVNDCYSPIGTPVVVAIKSCITYCTKPGTAGTALTSSVGILTKGTEPSVTGWPETVPNGYLVLDAETKGMVVTHMTTDEINALTPVEGMLVYDTEEQCVKLYRGTSPGVQTTKTGWVCIERICNE